jgi:hypothetical protein
MSRSSQWAPMSWVWALLPLLIAGTGRADYIFQTIDYPGIPYDTIVSGINASGTIVGSYDFRRGQSGSFVESGGVFTPIAVPGHELTTHATGINDAGDVVGYYGDSKRVVHGFLEKAGVYTTFDAPGALFGTFATGINNAGDIVGYYHYGKDATGERTLSHGFLLSKGAFTTLDVPGSSTTYGFGIDGSGNIVGVSYFGARFEREKSFRWSSGTYTTFSLPGESPYNVYAVGASPTGKIVGFDGDGNTFHGFVLNGNLEADIVDPKARGSDISGTYVYGTNDAGDVVGYYYDRHFLIHGFIGSPVPEPAGLPLAAIGVAGVAVIAWLRWKRIAG